MTAKLKDVVGFRGEKLLELELTNYKHFSEPLFRPGFLGDKWPAIDFYVELATLSGHGRYFFAQVKSTRSDLSPTDIGISTKKKDVERLLLIPGPTYIFGIHEPSLRVFVRAVYLGTPAKAISKIPLANELTPANLQALHDEVRDFWTSNAQKPTTSKFL